ncbi:MAG: sigma-70 family RNA polymerase sigma factor [Bryobacterales bacterium]|nr:sigma-70 family RNA polymerase sigma factor [Bryobacterales bacterium]
MLIEREVLDKARGGDDAAFNQIMQAYRKRIFGTIARIINRPQDVEDVAQEVFVRLYFSLKQLRAAEVFEPWLYRLTINASYDYLRRQKRRADSPLADFSEEMMLLADADASTATFQEERRQKGIRDLMDWLFNQVSEEDRILLTLKEVEGLSLKELQEIYEVNENALKVRLFRARQRVLRAYAKAGKEAGISSEGLEAW